MRSRLLASLSRSKFRVNRAKWTVPCKRRIRSNFQPVACERNLSERKNARLGDSSYELFYISWLVLQEDKLKARGTHTPIHGLASNSRMASTSNGQWQPWTAVSPLLALRSGYWLLRMPCGSQLTAPTCVVWSWRLKECYALLMTPKLSGCLCPEDMAVRMHEVLPGRGLVHVCPLL